MKHEHTAAALRVGLVRGIFPPLAAGIFLVLTEWVARGEWTPEIWTEYIRPHYESYILSWMLLALIWAVVDTVTRLAPLATFVSGCAGLVPAAVNFYTLQLRGEPFLPWDLTQVKEAAGVAAAAGLKVQPGMVWAGGALLALTVLSHFLYRWRGRPALPVRLVSIAASLAALLALVFGVFLQPAVTQSFGIYPDAWMQDRYYRWYGVITGFMTNLTNLEIDEPEGYSEEAVNALLDETEAAGAIRTGPNFPDSYAARTDPAAIEKEPTIIYVMDESYWDVSELEQYGVTFDTDVSPNLHALQQTSAYGKVYSPSFGGGTCDVEFEALTGHSVTMQNHTNYNAANYPDDQRVHVTSAPAGLKASTVGALEDFATGVRDADALLGQLVSYFSQVDEPVILVFWGDHYNPIDSGYDVYTATGYASADSADPRLHQTTLLMWSNYSNYQVDLGTIAAYEISPVMMGLFGLEQPLYFQYLNRQLRYGYRSCTGGVTVNWDGTAGRGLTGRQTAWRQDHWLLQYDLMFGKGYALDRMGLQLEKTE